MITELVTLDPAAPDPGSIARAAEQIRAGRLVAFPTETVYGLGANALNSAAVQGIFRAKGRPASNPLIVHVHNSSQIVNVAAEWPETAARLAARFWPGPLTLVVPKQPTLPDEVTAGGPTVAVRCPDHPIAQALLQASGIPIAAPSANRSTELSPTRAEHVLRSLGGRIDMILDGGLCPGGIESTVVDVTGEFVRLLRPGLVTVPMLEEIVGTVKTGSNAGGIIRSPGQMEKHYSPRTRLRLVDGNHLLEDAIVSERAGQRVGSVSFTHEDASSSDSVGARGRHVSLPTEPDRAAARLYETLHRLDQSDLDLILIELPPDTPEWAAVRDRLIRAAAN
jgi:L-threonylcarbamoyladenylate synthase